jgi:hypothetical protein
VSPELQIWRTQNEGLKTRNGNKQSAEWKQMEHIGNKMAVLLPNVSTASFLNPQGLGKKACIAM